MDCEIVRKNMVRIGVYAELGENRLAGGDSTGVEDALREIERSIAKIREEQETLRKPNIPGVEGRTNE